MITRTALDLDSQERFISLRRELGVTSFGINLLTLRPGQRGRIHRHREQEEVYLVLRGTLSLGLEDGEIEIGENEIVRVPASTRRQLSNRGESVCVLVALGGAGEHVGRDGEAFESWDDTQGRPPQEVPLPPDLP